MQKEHGAITYFRYSTEDQQRSSNADQISAEEPSDATAASSPALINLLNSIEQDHGRIASLIVDDTSRLGLRHLRHIDDLLAELAQKSVTPVNRS